VGRDAEFKILDPTATMVGPAPSSKLNFSISFRDRAGRIFWRNSIPIQSFESLRRSQLKITRIAQYRLKKHRGGISSLGFFQFLFSHAAATPSIEWQTKVASCLYSGLRFAMHSAQDVWKFEQFELLSCKRTQTKSSFARIFLDMFCVS